MFLVWLVGNDKFYSYSLRGTQIAIKSFDPKLKPEDEAEVTHVHYGNIDILVKKKVLKKTRRYNNTTFTGSSSPSSNSSIFYKPTMTNETIKQLEKLVKSIENEITKNQVNKKEKSKKQLQNGTILNNNTIAQQEKFLNKSKNDTLKNQIGLDQKEENIMKLKNITANLKNTSNENVNQIPLEKQNLTIQNININKEYQYNIKSKKDNEKNNIPSSNSMNKQTKENQFLNELIDFEQENYPINTKPQKLFMNYINNQTDKKGLSTTNAGHSVANVSPYFKNNSNNDFYQANIIKRDNEYVQAKTISNDNVFYKKKEQYYQLLPQLTINPTTLNHQKIILPQLHIVPIK